MSKVKKIKKISKVLRRDRRPREISTRGKAIRSFCILCSGNNTAEVRRCNVKTCHLFPYKSGTTDIEIFNEKGERFPNEVDYTLEKRDMG